MDYPRPAFAMSLDALQIQKILPHRYPFLFIDRVVEVEPGERIVAEKLVSQNEPILQGHFPGFPIFPGVVQVEAMAQASALLANLSGAFNSETHNCLFIGIQEAKFRSPVVPGEVLTIEVKALRLGRIGRFEGLCRVGDVVKSSAKFTAVMQPKDSGGDAS